MAFDFFNCYATNKVKMKQHFWNLNNNYIQPRITWPNKLPIYQFESMNVFKLVRSQKCQSYIPSQEVIKRMSLPHWGNKSTKRKRWNLENSRSTQNGIPRITVKEKAMTPAVGRGNQPRLEQIRKLRRNVFSKTYW